MSGKNQRLLSAVIVALASAVWAPLSVGQTAPADQLTKAKGCMFTGSRFRNGEKTTGQMTLQNDGGWCWTDGYASPSTGRYLIASDLVISDPPKHGRVTVGDMPNHYLRIAYQPQSGFVGQDSFTIHCNVADAERAVSVTVTK